MGDGCFKEIYDTAKRIKGQFPMDMVREILGEDRAWAVERTGACPTGPLNMTLLALSSPRYINCVAMRHGEVSRSMFPQYPIRAITNGVHAATWTTAPFRQLGSLYHKLERVIVPMFYSNPDAYVRVMRGAIAANGSFFNTHRMAPQYLDNAWFQWLRNATCRDALSG